MAKRSRRFQDFDEVYGGEAAHWKGQRDKSVEERFQPRPNRPTKPLTAKHRKYQKAIEEHDIVLCAGPAGTGKTSLACEVAVKLLKAGTVSKIVLTRPLVQCDEELGILPGELREKLSPYLAPLVESLKELLGAREFSLLESQGVIEVCPLATMRGKTFHGAFVIVDEAQNCTFGQLKMALSRLGHNSKLVVNGDIEQADLGMESPLIEVWRRLKAPPRHPGYAFCVLGEDEVLRPDIVRFTTKRLCGSHHEPSGRSLRDRSQGEHREGDQECVLSQTFATHTTSPPPAPGPSYSEIVKADPRGGSSS